MSENSTDSEAKAVEETNNDLQSSGEKKVDISTFFAVKAGMTRMFDEQGNHVPITVVKLIPNVISQVKTAEKEGYNAYQLAYNEKREKLLNKPTLGHLKKAKIKNCFTKYSEVKVQDAQADALGNKVSLGHFEVDSYVDVTGTSKGKGFQGVIKKFGFKGGPATHGSHFHRGPGSVGMSASPGEIQKGKKMPGQLGNVRRTVQNLKVVKVSEEKGFMLIKGSLPGSKNGILRISKSVKK